MTDNEEGDAMDLMEFLLARITEDEYDARRALGLDLAARLKDQAEHVAHLHGSATPPDEPNAADRLWWTTQDVVQWLAPYGPARVVAECSSHRRIVAEWETIDPGQWGDGALRLLALPYADHPDYREEWKP